MAKQTKLLIGGIFFTLCFLNIAVAIYSDSQKLLHWSSCALNTVWSGNEWNITALKRNDLHPILHVDDQVLAVRGLPPQVKLINPGYNLPVPAGTQLTMLIRCEGEVHEIPVQTYGASLQSWMRSLASWITILSFFVTGLFLLVMKAEDEKALLLSLMLGTFPGLFNYEVVQIPYWLFICVLFVRGLSYFHLPLLFHFFMIFPQPLKILERFPKLIHISNALFFIFCLPYFLLMRGNQIFGWASTGPLSVVRRAVSVPGVLLMFGFLIGGVMALFLNYRQSERVEKRKLQIVVVGCGIGFTNLILVILMEILGMPRRYPNIYEWANVSLMFTLMLIPISFAYAIVKHQVISVSLIIRRGMRYVLVSRGSYLLEVLIFVVLISIFLMGFFEWYFSVYKPENLASFGKIVGFVSAVVSVVAWQITRRIHHRYLAPIIDRKFFRQSYDSHRIISSLAESLRTTTEHHVLFQEVATKIQSALQTESVAIFVQDKTAGDYYCSYLGRYDVQLRLVINESLSLRVAKESNLILQLQESSQCLELDDLVVRGEDEHLIAATRTELLLPLSGQRDLLGFISLGSRLGDLPFSGDDRELLMSVASPVAFAIENSFLMERMISEAKRTQELEAENEARAKELEEARLLQLSMLPRKLPRLPNIDIAAFMKTATEVGGDYYDFHVDQSGTLTIAVGDATGHGLKAGTVVTATKSLFNNLAGLPDLTDIFRQSSLALKQMNLRSLFMAMTMVKLQGLELQISLAGMPPVLIYRADEQSIEEIALRGMPLGSVTNFPYKTVTTKLQAGDIVMMMSDGFPERFDVNNEMIGFEKAASLLQAAAGQSAQQIINHFIAYGDEWGGQRPQDDDVTFVVLKVQAGST